MAQYINAGLYRLLLWKVYTDATNVPFMGGTAGEALANDETSHAYVLDGINSLTTTGGDLTLVNFQGGDANLGNMQFGDSGLTGLTFVMDDLQNAVITNVHGSAVDTTSNSFFEQWTAYTNAASSDACGLAFVMEMKDLANAGKKFRTVIFPSCSVVFTRQFGGFQAKNTITGNVTINPASYHPLGTALSAMSMSIPGNKTDSIELITDYPIHMTCYRSDGTETTFVTGYRPISTVVTVNASPNWFARNGTDQALSSIVTTTGVATMAAAGTAGDANVLIYQTEYVAI